VKIEPKAIGVGQYQHDVNQTKLARSLDAGGRGLRERRRRRREYRLGAAAHRISGLNATLAANIVAYRDAHGAFPTPQALLGVPRSATRPSSRPPASCASRTATTRSTPRRCTRKPTRWSSASSPTSSGRGKRRDRRLGDANACAPRPAQIHRRALRPADRAGHPAGTGKARPRPAPRVQDRHLQATASRRSRTCSPACCSKAWSPTSPTSAPSSTSACIRTAWCTSRRWPTNSSRTRTRWSRPATW
jgi:hypothetical protein